MPPKPKLNVQSFPRPPLIEKTNRHLQVKYQGQIIADTKDAYWVLETYHPPSMLYLSTCTLSIRIQVCCHSTANTIQYEERQHFTKSSHPQHITEYKHILTCYSAYYFPPSSIKLPLTKTSKSTYCEWKGYATYHNINLPSSSSSEQPKTVRERIWSYENPNSRFKDLKDHLSFYAGEPWQCFVDGEEVIPQPGDFYGGWTTSELEGIIKGDAKTRWL